MTWLIELDSARRPEVKHHCTRSLLYSIWGVTIAKRYATALTPTMASLETVNSTRTF